jgi:hypothetical protein
MAVITTGAVILAGCAENRGFTKMRDDARPFAEAHSDCWQTSMNIAGFAATAAQVQAYDSCMARNGWSDQRPLI